MNDKLINDWGDFIELAWMLIKRISFSIAAIVVTTLIFVVSIGILLLIAKLTHALEILRWLIE